MGKMDGKVAMITGASTGMGIAMAETLCREGAKVTFCGKPVSAGEEVERDLRSKGYEATYIEADVSMFDSMKAFAEKTVELYGGIDALVCNAGVQRHGSIETQTVEEWDLVINTDLKGPFLSSKVALPYLKESKLGGTIVITASMAAFSPMPNQIAYQAAKAGALMLGRTIAREVAEYGVRCNVLCPGGVATPMAVSAMAKVPPEMKANKALWDRVLHPFRNGQIATPQEMANVVLFLSCDDSSFVTGTHILADGGMTLGMDALTLPKKYKIEPAE